jgi:hypothetical protein
MNTPPPTVSFTEGVVRGIVYDFANVGDGLPRHSHDAASVHITIVATGEVEINGKRYAAGRSVVFRVGQSHEIIATQPHTRVYNILTGMAP